MSKPIIFSIIFSLIILLIILLILILKYEFSPWLHLLQVIPVFLSVLSILYLKQYKCKCGKDEYKKSGGVNNLDNVDIQKKKLISQLINFIKNPSKTPYNNTDETELNNLLLEIDPILVQCTPNGRDFLGIDPIFRVLKVNLSTKDNYEEFTDVYETKELSEYVTRELIFNTDSYLSPVKNSKDENYELIGFITGDNIHFKSYVKYENGWYKRDSLNYQNSTNNQIINASEIEKIIHKQFQKIINGTRGICYVLYRNMNKTKLKKGIPPIFKQFASICYVASPLQLLCATNLLETDEDLNSSVITRFFKNLLPNFNNKSDDKIREEAKALEEAKGQEEAKALEEAKAQVAKVQAAKAQMAKALEEAKGQEEAKAQAARGRDSQLLDEASAKFLPKDDDNKKFEDAKEYISEPKEDKKSIPFTTGLPISEPIDPKIIENYHAKQAISIASRQQSKNVQKSPFDEFLKKNQNL